MSDNKDDRDEGGIVEVDFEQDEAKRTRKVRPVETNEKPVRDDSMHGSMQARSLLDGLRGKSPILDKLMWWMGLGLPGMASLHPVLQIILFMGTAMLVGMAINMVLALFGVSLAMLNGPLYILAYIAKLLLVTIPITTRVLDKGVQLYWRLKK